MNILGIQFVPLNIPLKRRLQTLSTVGHLIWIVIGPFIFSALFLLLLFTNIWWVSAGYACWVVYDIYIARTARQGGRRCKWLRKGRQMEYLRDYFPISLVKTADLDPKQNYVIGYHPHGIVPLGALCNFGSDATNFESLYPGIQVSPMTLNVNLVWPLVREYGLLLGFCDVSRESIEWVLSREGSGQATMIIVGGAAEAFTAKPGSYRVVLKERKGFIKIAVRTGAYLVPCYSFGENNLYKQLEYKRGTIVREVQEFVKSLLTIAPPLFYGRGVFNYTIGMAPYRTPINTVVGAPIATVKDSHPTPDQIDRLHAQYVSELCALFDRHKKDYGIPEDQHLEVI